jgi:Bifunctional DNA primase/polymerase, N-terminal
MNRLDSEDRGARRFPPDDALGAALWLTGRGLWAVPITPLDDPLSPNPGKAPIGRGWGARRLSTRALFAIFRRQPRAGIGLVLGPAAGVVDLEVDDREQAGPLLAKLFPAGLPPTMGWISSRGEHRLFRWDDRLDRASAAVVHLADGAVEFRLGSGGKQLGAVCPPSLGADGRPRRWNGVWEIAPCPEVLIELVTQMANASVPRRQPARASRPRLGGTPGRYALVALEREAGRVRAAGPGTRNSTLNRAAFRLGQLVTTCALDRTVVEAALAAGLGEREVERTIHSGLEAGLAHPRGSGMGL